MLSESDETEEFVEYHLSPVAPAIGLVKAICPLASNQYPVGAVVRAGEYGDPYCTPDAVGGLGVPPPTNE